MSNKKIYIAKDGTWIGNEYVNKGDKFTVKSKIQETDVEQALKLGSIVEITETEEVNEPNLNLINENEGEKTNEQDIKDDDISLVNGIGATTTMRLKEVGVENQTQLKEAIQKNKPEVMNIISVNITPIKKFLGLR